jgi:hypothetical protein
MCTMTNTETCKITKKEIAGKVHRRCPVFHQSTIMCTMTNTETCKITNKEIAGHILFHQLQIQKSVQHANKKAGL